ncbi:polyisoprenoid-binding protein [Ktedonobacteria bacterium brp13]|nr:polyisoprenoid-binding protein [Ktedonobacteria bacterium brp13]
MIWEIDAIHSQAAFAVRYMMISTVKGRFKGLQGKLALDKEHLERSRVEAEVDVASIDTGDSSRDTHLRSPDFFDAEKYPTMTFKSTKVEAAAEDGYRVTGDLTMHGITREVIFVVVYHGQAKDFSGKLRVGLSAKAQINRKDFDLTWNMVLETGGVVVSEDVRIEVDLQAIALEEKEDFTE